MTERRKNQDADIQQSFNISTGYFQTRCETQQCLLHLKIKMFCPETYPELKNRQNTELMEQFAEYTKKNMYKVINIMFHTRKKNKCRKLSVL